MALGAYTHAHTHTHTRIHSQSKVIIKNQARRPQAGAPGLTSYAAFRLLSQHLPSMLLMSVALITKQISVKEEDCTFRFSSKCHLVHCALQAKQNTSLVIADVVYRKQVFEIPATVMILVEASIVTFKTTVYSTEV